MRRYWTLLGILLAFIALITFFDENNLMYRWELNRELDELSRDVKYYKDEIERSEKILNEIFTDDAALERYAREVYLMKAPDEDIYIIEDKNERKN